MTSKTKNTGVAACGLAIAMTLTAGAAVAPAQAQSLNGVVGCDAPGNKQAGGALIGALVGAAAGSNLAKNDRGTGTAIGAIAGAATGSYVGCRMQRGAAANNAYAAPAAYSHGGYRLSGQISPANLTRDGGTYVANSTINVRSGPTTSAGRVGQLRTGEAFQALGRVRGAPWVLVGQGGVGVGYVHEGYIRPAAYDNVAYRY